MSGSCRDAAGNSGAASFGFKYDSTPPTVNVTPSRPADANGWYNHALTVSFSGSDSLSGGVSCDNPATYAGPGSATASQSGKCTDAAGNKGTASLTFKYDATPPTVTPMANRPADSGGWYNHTLAINWTANDALSGPGSCTDPAAYSGPDSAAASASGSCTDVAGNTGTASFTFKYDATPPSVGATSDRGADANGWYNHALTVAFAGTDALSDSVTCSPASKLQWPRQRGGASERQLHRRCGQQRYRPLRL